MNPAESFLIGKIVGAHGLKGGIKIRSYADSDTVFAPGTLICVKGTGTGEADYTIQQAGPYKRGVRLFFSGIDSREKAEALVDSDLYISRSDLPALEEDVYYWSDLMGLSVFDADAPDRCLGRISDIIATGGNDVYVVTPDKARNQHPAHEEVLIPALASVVQEVDLENRCMTVRLPEGLI